jgi:D-sedoheptulose 7-phosphate isomerase
MIEEKNFVAAYLDQVREIAARLDHSVIERMAGIIAEARAAGGRLFFLGVGGSAANCSHAVNDFRKIVGIEAYAPTDNVSELTARTNDEGWAVTFVNWLKVSRLKAADVVCVLSVGGGNLDAQVSPNLVLALDFAKEVGARIVGIVGRNGGHAAKVADACVIVPAVDPELVTPHSEAFQEVICHLLAYHPRLRRDARLPAIG